MSERSGSPRIEEHDSPPTRNDKDESSRAPFDESREESSDVSTEKSTPHEDDYESVGSRSRSESCNSSDSCSSSPHNESHKLPVDPLAHRRTLTEIPSTPTNSSYPSMFFEKYQIFRYQCGTFVNHPKVQILMVAMIAVNALMMGIGTFDFVENNPQVTRAFDVTDQVFLSIFTIELGLQFVFRGWRLLTDSWLCFDLVVIIVSWAFDSFQIIRAFRVLRALRLITRVKVMQNLVVALFSVVPRMFAIGLLLMLVSYIFAVMLTELFQDAHEEGITEINYFGTLFASFFTLFQYMVSRIHVGAIFL